LPEEFLLIIDKFSTRLAYRIQGKDFHDERREFLRIGIMGTTSAMLGLEGLADAVQHVSTSPFVFHPLSIGLLAAQG